MKRYARNTFICFLSNLIEQMIDNYEVLLNCKEFYKAFDNDQKKALRDDVDTQLCDLLENCDYGIPTVVSKEQTIVETDTTEHKRETNIETGIEGELSTKPSFFASLMARFGHKRNKAKQQKSSEEVKTTKRYSFSFSETKRILERLLWLAMDSELCIQYMSLMAKYLADLAVNPTVVGTDKTKYLHHAYKKTFRSKKSLALYICFQDVLPQPAPDASLKKIIKFKDKRQTELSEFQYQLLQFENKLSHSTSIDEAKDQIELFKKQLEKSILEIEKIYKDEKINYTFGTINAFVDALGIAGSISSIASLVAMAASLPTWAIISTIGTGAALGIGYSFLQHKMTANHERLTNDFAYLYDLYQNKIIL